MSDATCKTWCRNIRTKVSAAGAHLLISKSNQIMKPSRRVRTNGCVKGEPSQALKKRLRQSGARCWLAILSTRIWSITESMWKHRNKIEDGNDKNNLLSQDRHETLNGEIDRIYTRTPALRLLPMTARHFFNKTKAWRKNRTIRENENGQGMQILF